MLKKITEAKKKKKSRKKEQHKISKREKMFWRKKREKREKRDEENVVLIHVKINHKTTTEKIKRQRKSSLSISQSGLDRSHQDVASTMQLVIQGAHLQHSEARIK